MYLENYIVKGGENRSLLADRWENNSSVSSCGLQINNNWAGADYRSHISGGLQQL